MNEKYGKIISYILFAVVALIWGLSFLVTKIALEGLNAYEVLALRWGVTMAAFMLLIAIRVIKVDYRGKNLRLLAMTVLFQPCLYAIFPSLGVSARIFWSN